MHAFAQRVARTLPLDYEIIFGTSEPAPHLLIKSGKYIDIPKYSSSTFNHEWLNLAISEGLEIIIPLRKEEIIQLAESRDLFDEYGIKVAVPTLSALKSIDFLFNPGIEFIPTVIINGKVLNNNEDIVTASNESGVCLLSDSGEDLLYCCLTNE